MKNIIVKQIGNGKMKKLSTFLVMLAFISLVGNVKAQYSGTTGECTWSVDTITHTLTISGNGAMANYGTAGPPWYFLQISTVVFIGNVTSIGSNAFAGTNLTSITIPNSVTSIGSSAFAGTNLTSITIPSNVTNIGAGAFACSYLQTLNYNATNCTVQGTAWPTLTTLNIGNTVQIIPHSFVAGCTNLTSVIIPSNVTSIGAGAFGGTGLTSIFIPNSVTSIGAHAFSYCTSLTSITLPNSITSIEEHTFSCCTSLSSIVIPNSVTSIGHYAFSGDNWTSGCSFVSIIIPSSVISIGDAAFSGCTSLTSITLQNGISEIGMYAFSDCVNLTSITIPESITYIGYGTFSGCSSLQTLNYNTINDPNPGYLSPFFDCVALNTLNIGNQVKILSTSTFWDCYNLQTVNYNAIQCTVIDYVNYPNSVFNSVLAKFNIGNAVQFISNKLIRDCTGLTSIKSEAIQPPTTTQEAFFSVPANIPVYVPCGSLEAYKTASGWNKFTNIQCDENENEVTLHWDYCCAQPAIQPKGVAADGVARLLVKIKDPQNKIQSVSANLTADKNFETPNILGKLYSATEINQYSDEANHATATLINNVLPNQNGEVWLWYVAPDDFLEYPTPANPTYEDESMRNVYLNIEVLRIDNNTLRDTVPIEIVRPPLMLVHGLNSSEHCWDQFHYDIGFFINSPLFKQKRAINLCPDGAFATNATILLSEQNENSFKHNINSLRQKGYAANQVDYVCHSMGGCVLRKAIEYIDWYYSDYNYGKGFVHKAITINTPHNGSPVANFVTEHASILSDKIWKISEYIPFDPYVVFNFAQNFFLPNGQATNAVKDLQMGNNGVRFGTTNVKNHNIAGDINMYYLPTIELPSYIKLLTFMWAEVIKQMGYNIFQGWFDFFNAYCEQKGVSNFFGDGDGVVSLASQLAQREGHYDDSYQYNKVFSSGFDVSHTEIVDKVDVGMWVKDLLNTSVVYSNKFRNTIDADENPPISKSFEKSNLVLKTVVKIFDNSHIEIISPNSYSDFGVNDSLYLTFQIKDTTNLMFVDYLFQDDYRISIDKNEMQTAGFKVSPDFLGKQTIYVIANYDMGDETWCYIDTISTTVSTTENLTDFKINPKFANIYTTQYYYPQMQAIYETFISNIPCNSDKLTVSVNDASIVSYDQSYYCFVGKAEGSAFAIISYEHLQDTIYFNVMLLPDTLPNVGIKEIDSQKPLSNELNINVYPNPTNNTVTVAFDYLIQGTMALYDIFGKKVSAKEISNDKAIIDMSNLSSGVYILQVVTTDRIVGHKKIIKQ